MRSIRALIYTLYRGLEFRVLGLSSLRGVIFRGLYRGVILGCIERDTWSSDSSSFAFVDSGPAWTILQSGTEFL